MKKIDVPPLFGRTSILIHQIDEFFDKVSEGAMVFQEGFDIFVVRGVDESCEAKLTHLNELKKGFDVYFSIGTTSLFPYIKQPIIQAKNQKKPTIEINPDTTEISDLVDIKIQLKATDALEMIWDGLRNFPHVRDD